MFFGNDVLVGRVMARGRDFIFGLWRFGGCKCAIVVTHDDRACRSARFGARLDEWRRSALVVLTIWDVCRIGGRRIRSCGTCVGVCNQAAAAVGEDRGTGGGKLDCCDRIVAAGLGSATRLTTAIHAPHACARDTPAIE